MILAFGPGPYTAKVSAMGQNPNAVRTEEQKVNGTQDKKNHGHEFKGEVSSEPEKDGTKTEEPSPKKEPRIKYRDMFECSC